MDLKNVHYKHLQAYENFLSKLKLSDKPSNPYEPKVSSKKGHRRTASNLQDYGD